MRTLICLIFLLIGQIVAAEEKSSNTGVIIDTITNKYIHSWYKFPVISGKRVGNPEKLTFKPKRGYATVAIFMASWCIPCQVLVRDFIELEKKYKNRHTTFVYIFAHDTEADAKGFIDAYKLDGYSILADVGLMKTFHQPDLPTIYLGDRYGWLTWRKLSTKHEHLTELDQFLALHTAL